MNLPTGPYMDREDEFLAVIQEKESPGRYQHSRNVAKAALKLAERNGADLEKAYVCGLLHDVEKNAPKEEQKRYMKQLGETLPQYVFDNPKLWHAPAGAAYVRDELGIVDEEMIHAIKYHTTGRPGMTVLERIIYVADFISDERDYPGVEKVRETAYRNLDEAILIGSQFTLVSLLKSWCVINYDTIAMYNEVAEELGSRMEGHK
ncbi:MAG: bis(5'-nucleosyl)-tetraphosphatase (symmetrical) YqeK [Acutalibacteraceae bacterium]|jgi:predicted HD superfamily hydrolase involved in NAD metabolism